MPAQGVSAADEVVRLGGPDATGTVDASFDAVFRSRAEKEKLLLPLAGTV